MLWKDDFYYYYYYHCYYYHIRSQRKEDMNSQAINTYMSILQTRFLLGTRCISADPDDDITSCVHDKSILQNSRRSLMYSVELFLKINQKKFCYIG